jgi:hypothetical protein
MLTQAAGLAVLAALSPTALLVSAVFLGSTSPRRTVLIYLAGAIVMTAILGTVIFVVLQAGHLQRPHQHQARYGLRLGLGVLMLLAGGWLARRGARKPDPAKQGKGIISRMIAKPGPREAFLVGLLVYSPSLTFVAAIQVVATSKDSVAASVGAIAFVIAITVLFVWGPLVLYLLMPERTGRLLRGFNGWLRSHGHLLAVGALLIGGVVLTIDGIIGVV